MRNAIEGSTVRITLTCQDSEGDPIDFTSALSVQIQIVRPSPATALSLDALVSNASGGVCYADIPATSLTGLGQWAAYVVATWPSGNVVKTGALAFGVIAEGTVVAE